MCMGRELIPSKHISCTLPHATFPILYFIFIHLPCSFIIWLIVSYLKDEISHHPTLEHYKWIGMTPWRKLLQVWMLTHTFTHFMNESLVLTLHFKWNNLQSSPLPDEIISKIIDIHKITGQCAYIAGVWHWAYTLVASCKKHLHPNI